MVIETKIIESRTELQEAILDTLRQGKANAITGQKLARRLGFNSTRQIRQEIRGLIKRGFPIIGSVTPPYGYYVAENADECQAYITELSSYLVENALRRRDFKRAARPHLQPHQIKLEI